MLDYFRAVVMSDWRKVCVQLKVFSGKVIVSADVLMSEPERSLQHIKINEVMSR